MEMVTLGSSALQVSKICLGTMTFGEQNSEADAHSQLDYALERGINFIDTAEMYPVMPRATTQGATERFIGSWIKRRGGCGDIVLASKIAGPAPHLDWVRGGANNFDPANLRAAVEGSLRRLQTEHIDLYQLHWPSRNVPIFGARAFDPRAERPSVAIEDTLAALGRLIEEGKMTARHFETSLLNETCFRDRVSLLAYSPLAFGQLSGKYLDDPQAPGRLNLFPKSWSPRYLRPGVLAASAQYAALARAHGMTPAHMALAWCYSRWFVASTIIGATTLAQLRENIDAYSTVLSDEVLAEIDRIHASLPDPGQ
jgi:aryl-alcohol dehydrogenase-like predicted oxidoreductase